MLASMASRIELINDAFSDARASDGRRVSFKLYDVDGDASRVTATAALRDDNDTIVDMRTWEMQLPDADATRIAAFATALRTLPLDWEAMYPEEFPPWGLLDVASLVSVEDFARVMSSRELLRATLARAFVEDAHPTDVHLEKTRFGALPTFTGEGAAEIDERFERIRLL